MLSLLFERPPPRWSERLGRCLSSGTAKVLIHISPYQGEHSHHPQNGLLLRADLHSLFDLELIAINPATMKVIISKRLLGSQYEDHDGQVIKEPTEPILGPSFEALKEHLGWSGIVADRTNKIV